MRISGASRTLAAAGVALALTLTLTATSYAGATTWKAAGRPAVGECRSLTVAEANAQSDTSSPIDCAQPHNTRVIAVRNLPKGVTYADLDTAAKIVRTGEDLCYPAFRAAVGPNDRVIDRTAYTFVFFIPTAQQRSQGARWLRCDLTVLHGTTYGNLPTDALPALSGSTIPRNARRCLTGRSHLVTTCATSHAFRATGSFTVGLARFPGHRRVVQIGRNRCPALVFTDRSFLFTWKPKATYNRQHDQTVVCFSHTST